jgi:hypothetical protein
MHAFVQLDVFAADKTRRIFVHADDPSNPERLTLPMQPSDKTPDFCPFNGVSHHGPKSGAQRPLDRRARADEAKVDKVDALQRGREFATH